MLFDLKNDPEELRDLGADPAYEDVRQRMYVHLHNWSMRMSQRVTQSDADIAKKKASGGSTGVVLGLYTGAEVPLELTQHYRGPIPK